MQLLNLASVTNRTRQVAQYGSVSMVDDIFTASHRNRCRSSLRPIQPGIADLRPAWKIPGTTEKVQNVKMAAVLVPLCFVNKEPSILLTVRSSQLLGHKGEVSFPGGMVDNKDIDVAHTARREAFEEIGLQESNVEIWGRLGVFPGKRFAVAVVPVIGFCGEIDIMRLKISRAEVDDVFAPALASLADTNNVAYTRFRGDNVDYLTPVFLGQSYKIWGLTAVILHQVLRVVIPEAYNVRFSLLHASHV